MEDEEYEEYYSRYMSPRRRRVRRALKITAVVFVVVINAFLIWRAFFSGNIPGSVGSLTVTDAVCDAYGERGKSLEIYTQEHDQLTWNDRAYGYFWAAQTRFIPDAREIQLLVRYNNSTLTHIADDYRLPVVPAREEEVIDVTLLVTRKTGEYDDKGNPITVTERILSTGDPVASGQKNMYNYRRFIFDGVILDDSVTDVTVNFYYKGDIDYSAEAYGDVCIYDDRTENVPVRLSARDWKRIESGK